MSNLKKIGNEERESKFGYVFAVSGPGKEFFSLAPYRTHDSPSLPLNSRDS